MPGKRIAYIGIDLLYPALPALIEAGCEIMEVITCETDNVTEFNVQVCEYAKKRGIPLFIGKISAERLSVLRERGCEAVVCGGYYYRIPVVEGLKMVNIHPSLLPVGRGAWPMPVTILKGLRVSGVTVHRMTEGFDEGAILLQEEIPVSPKENLLTLTKKQKAVLPGMMRRLAADLDTLYEQAKPQGAGEYWPCPSEEDYPLTPDTPFEEADRILRAFYGYECVYEADGVRYGLIEGVAVKKSVSSTGVEAGKNRADSTGVEAGKNSVSSIGSVAEKSETGKEMPGEFPLRDGRIRTGRCRIINGEPRHAKLPTAMPWPAKTERTGRNGIMGKTMEISLSMRGQIENLRLQYGRITASHAFATLYIWREDMGLSVCLEDHLYAVKCRWRGENAWFFPCGKREAVCRFIGEQMKTPGLGLCYMGEADVELLEKEFPGAFWISEAENDYEYLYDCAEQRALEGKRFAAIRNHIRRAKTDHVLECELLSRENLAEAMKVNRQWVSRSSGQPDLSMPTDRPGGAPPDYMAPANLQEGMLEDGAASETLLREWDALGSFGVLIRADGEPHAVAAGYPLSADTYDLCLAKQRFTLPGLGAYTKHAFFCALPESVAFVNAEEDLGIEGLRQMKRQMRPSRMLKMYEAGLR